MIHIDRFPRHSTTETIVIITHHHHDHIQGPKKSFRGIVITSSMTHQLLPFDKKLCIIPLAYFQNYETPMHTIQLIPTHHCAGSTGIILYDKSTQIYTGYTGDFRIWDTSSISTFLQPFLVCSTLYYDDSFEKHDDSYTPIPSLSQSQHMLQQRIFSSTTPLSIYINRTGLEILLKSMRHQLTVTLHPSLSHAMKRVLPILFPPELCRGPYQIMFTGDKSKADIVPECTSCYMDKCYKLPLCFHNTPDELRQFLLHVPSHIECLPLGYHIPLPPKKENIQPT
jgi:hypothetical protein